MVLADTSISIEHFRHREPTLAERFWEGLGLMQAFVSGELACGNLRDRAVILSDLEGLPPSRPAAASCRTQ